MFKANKLSLIANKSCMLREFSAFNGDVVIDNLKLIKVDSVKYLGVIIDHKLNWIEHISSVKYKISKNIGIMSIAYFYNTKLFGQSISPI